MRYILYPAIVLLLAFTAAASSRDLDRISDLCDPPLISSTTICSGESITRYISNPDATYTYNWYADPLHNILLATGTSFTTPVLYSTTDYYVVAISGSCSAETMITITVITIIPPDVPNDTNCILTNHFGHPYVHNPQPGYTYNWYGFDGTLLYTGVAYTFDLNPLPNYSSYTVEAVFGNCRSQRIPVTVIDVAPLDIFSHDTTICQGNAVALFVDNPNASYSYHWYDSQNMTQQVGGGAVFNTPVLGIPTTYYLQAHFRDCYSFLIPVVVNIYTPTPPVANDVIICPGTSAALTVQDPVAGVTYNWYGTPQGGTLLGTGITYTTAPLSSPATFYVSANDGICTTNSELTPVAVNFAMSDSPKVTVVHVDFNTVTFTWQAIANVVGYEVSVNGGLFITPTSGIIGTTHTISGLLHEQTVNITVRPIFPSQFCGFSVVGHGTAITFGDGFYVPSAFTPNADTRNDIMKPIVPVGSILEYFTIYDRWGQSVFTTNKNGEGWDGKIKGKAQPVGTYVWICRYLFAGRKTIEQKGSFILLH